jgi:hypothetical protein
MTVLPDPIQKKKQKEKMQLPIQIQPTLQKATPLSDSLRLRLGGPSLLLRPVADAGGQGPAIGVPPSPLAELTDALSSLAPPSRQGGRGHLPDPDSRAARQSGLTTTAALGAEGVAQLPG